MNATVLLFAIGLVVALDDKGIDTQATVCGEVVYSGTEAGTNNELLKEVATAVGKPVDSLQVWGVRQGKTTVVGIAVPRSGTRAKDLPINLRQTIVAKGRLITTEKLAIGKNLGDNGKRSFLVIADTVRPRDETNDSAVATGKAYVEGAPVCGKCDLGKFETCTLAIANDKTPLVLSGELANDHAHNYARLGVIGTLGFDEKGLARLAAETLKETKVRK